jgi:hypothetical protein
MSRTLVGSLASLVAEGAPGLARTGLALGIHRADGGRADCADPLTLTQVFRVLGRSLRLCPGMLRGSRSAFLLGDDRCWLLFATRRGNGWGLEA